MVKIFTGAYSFGNNPRKVFCIPDGTVIKPNPHKFIIVWEEIDKKIKKILKKYGGKVPIGKYIEITSTKTDKDSVKLKPIKQI